MATYSSLAMVTSAVIYLLALVAHALEWASARRPALVGVPAGAPAPADPDPDAGPSLAEDRFSRIGVALTMVGAACHIAGVVLRGVAADRLPWGNMYEFVTSSLAFAVIFYLVLVWRFGWRWLGLPVTLLMDDKGCLISAMNGPAAWDSEDAKALINAALGTPKS